MQAANQSNANLTYGEHIDKPAHMLFPAAPDGLCHGAIRVQYEVFDSYRGRTLIISQCSLCGKCVANQIPSDGGQK